MANLQTFQILADILGILQEAQKDPDVLKKWAAEAHSVGEQGEAKANEARALIGQVDALTKAKEAKLAEITKMQNDITASKQEIDAYKQAVMAQADKLTKDKAKFSDIRSAHNDAVAAFKADKLANDVAASAMSAREAAVSARETKLATAKEALAIKLAEVKEYEQSLRDKADKLRAQTAALLA